MGILGIPNELLLSIGEYLSIRDLYHFLLTCSQLNSILNRRLHKLGLQDIGKQTALQWAAERGHASLAERAILGGAEIDKPDLRENGRPPLHSAARNNHLDVVRILVRNKAKISIRDSNGMTPLHYAAEETTEPLGKDADMMCANAEQPYPTFLAAEGGSVDSMMAPIDAGFDLAIRGHDDGQTIHKAVGPESILEYLLAQPESEMSIDAQDLYGHTALHMARNATNIKLLLRHGADMEVADRFGTTAGHFAAADLDLGCVKAFVEAGFDVTARRNKGRTVIHAAVENSSLRVVEYLLLQPGARSIIDLEDYRGWTAVAYAIEDKSWDVARLLVRHGANLDVEYWRGIMPDDKLQELSMESASSRRGTGSAESPRR